MGKTNCPGILEEIIDWSEGRDFGALPEKVTLAQEAPPYNELPENKGGFALFADGSCCVIGNYQRWKAAVWNPTQLVLEAAEGEGVKSICRSESHPISLRDCGTRKVACILSIPTTGW